MDIGAQMQDIVDRLVGVPPEIALKQIGTTLVYFCERRFVRPWGYC